MSNDPKDPLFHEDAPRSALSRILPPLVLMCAFGGFVALAIYAYRAGTQSVNEGELMVIEADATPVKEKPADPGGMQFPNQDKTIFETFSSGGQPPKVERILPTPEEPMPKAEDPAPATWANEKLATATPAAPVGAEQVFGDEAAPAPAADSAAPKVLNVQEELGKQAIAEAAPVQPVVTAKEELKEPEKPAQPVVVQEPVPAVSKPEAEVVKPVAKTPEKPKAVIAKELVQLGAYKSEAEAKADFAKIQKKNAALAGKNAVINRADLGEKGIFFRLRVATDNAKALCSKLSGNGQACMVVNR